MDIRDRFKTTVCQQARSRRSWLAGSRRRTQGAPTGNALSCGSNPPAYWQMVLFALTVSE